MIDHCSITAIIAARNEEANIEKCLLSANRAARKMVIDSCSQDRTVSIAESQSAEVVQFSHAGGYPKKRQWALDSLDITTDWVLFLDADEVIPSKLWDEIAQAIQQPNAPNGFFITKGFHFLGRRFRLGGFSFPAVILIRRGKARFEEINVCADDGLDMEVHERVIVEGPVGRLRTPLVHNDFKGLQAYIERHNRYSTWEAAVRTSYLEGGIRGDQRIRPRLLGNSQERRRFLKQIAIRIPFEPVLWFIYHYFLRLGFLEGQPGLIACQIRASYIAQVRAKMYESNVRKRMAMLP